MDAPPHYPPPPMYTPSRPTSPADDVLPDYDSPASLEPWLAPLRHHNWPALAPLVLFVDPAPAEAWADTRARLVRGLLARGLPLDGEHGLNSDWRAGAVPEAVCAAIRTEMPPELRRAAFARVVGHEPRASERPALNPLLLCLSRPFPCVIAVLIVHQLRSSTSARPRMSTSIPTTCPRCSEPSSTSSPRHSPTRCGPRRSPRPTSRAGSTRFSSSSVARAGRPVPPRPWPRTTPRRQWSVVCTKSGRQGRVRLRRAAL
jgi:hypothetical protein